MFGSSGSCCPFKSAAILSVLVACAAAKCPLKIITAVDGEVDVDKFESLFRHSVPVIFRDLTRLWQASNTWSSREGFLQDHGDLRVPLRQQIVQSTIDVGERNASFREYLSEDEHKHLIQFTFDNLGLYEALRSSYLQMPTVLRGIHRHPAFTLGRNGTGSGGHSHEEAWVAQISGRKVWILAPHQVNVPSMAVLPCNLLEARHSWPQGTLSCEVRPGEVIYVPDDWYHATCNLDDFTLGIGGKGDSSLWPDFFHHIQAGDEAALRSVIKTEGLDFSMAEQDDEEATHAFHLAAMAGHVSVLELLLQQRADPRVRDSEERLAIHFAAGHGSVEAMSYLISTGHATLRDHAGGTYPLHVATSTGHLAVVQWILSKGDDVLARDAEGAQPVHLAAATGRTDLVETILAHRADPEALDGGGKDVVSWAAGHNHIAVVDVLSKYGARLDAISGTFLTTPLHWAANKGFAEMAEHLLLNKVLVDKADGDKMTPLHWAADSGHLPVVEVLVRHNARLNVRSSTSMTPLKLAKRRKHKEVASYLSSIRQDL